MRLSAMVLICFVGCSGSSAPLPVSEVAVEHWASETKRIEDHEVFSETDPSDWLLEVSARTNRILTLPANGKVEALLPTMIESDTAFFAKPAPSDLAVLDGAECRASYLSAVRYAADRFRVSGNADVADSLETYAKGLE